MSGEESERDDDEQVSGSRQRVKSATAKPSRPWNVEEARAEAGRQNEKARVASGSKLFRLSLG